MRMAMPGDTRGRRRWRGRFAVEGDAPQVEVAWHADDALGHGDGLLTGEFDDGPARGHVGPGPANVALSGGGADGKR